MDQLQVYWQPSILAACVLSLPLYHEDRLTQEMDIYVCPVYDI